MRLRNTFIRSCVVVLSLALLAACGEDTKTETVEVPSPTVTISGDVILELDGTLQLTAATNDGTDAGYDWASNNEAVATVDENGLVTAVAAGEAFISATGQDTGAMASHGVAVVDTDGGGGDVPDPRVTVSGGVAVMLGETLQLSAATANGEDAGYDWSTGDEAIATVDENGLVTPVAAGEVMITATGQDTGAADMHGVYVFAEPDEGDDITLGAIDKWKNSPHADTESESFRHWDDDGEISTSCAKCHSTGGYLDFLGADGSAAGTVDAAAPLGTTVECRACHNGAAQAKTAVMFPSGAEITGLGAEARCMECHQGRQSKTSVDEAIGELDPDTASADLGFKNVHYFAAGATLFGKEAMGGYQYDGMAYDSKFEHAAGLASCITCHDPHSLEVRVSACTSCHAGVESAEDFRAVRMAGSLVDYDGDGDADEGIHGEIETLQVALYAALQTYAADTLGAPIGYDSHSYPYFFNDTNGDGTLGEDEATYSNAFASWSPRLLKAAYNYQFSLKDPGAYVHNGKYVIQLLIDSIADLSGGLATPIDMEGIHRNDHGHFAGSEESFRHWDEDGDVSASCARCHTATGLPFFLEHGVDIAQAPSNGLACDTCHVPGSADYALHEIAEVEFPSGVVIDNADGASAICMHCHQGRQSGADVAAAVAGLDRDAVGDGLRFLNVHYFAAGATRYGADVGGGYQYDGQTYVGYFPHVGMAEKCGDCHDVHTQAVQVASCGNCHDGVASVDDLHALRHDSNTDDYDGDGDNTEGVYAELEGLRTTLYAAIQAYALATDGVSAIIYDSHSYPYFFVDTNENGEVDAGEAIYPNAFGTWTPRLLQAAYNYQYAAKDHGAYAHNPAYVAQLLIDSIDDLGQDVTAMDRP